MKTHMSGYRRSGASLFIISWYTVLDRVNRIGDPDWTPTSFLGFADRPFVDFRLRVVSAVRAGRVQSGRPA